MIGLGKIGHVLLMLSSRKPPLPVEEMEFHRERIRHHGFTYVATRGITPASGIRNLKESRSKVAFFGDTRKLRHRYFGYGMFLEFIDNPERAKDILKDLATYERCYEEYAQCIKIEKFTPATVGQTIASLDGVMENGNTLSEENLPGGQRNAVIYFYDR
jgi:hypothetical protein